MRTWPSLALLAALGALAPIATLAEAQAPSAKRAPPAPASAVAPPASGTKGAPVSEEAKRHFKAGVDFLKDPDGARYEEAYREFRAAYQASPSWKILGNLGLCAMKLERNSEAIDSYERYLREGGAEIDPAERAQIEKDVNLTRTSSATVVFTLGSPGEATLLDERVKANGLKAVNVYPLSQGRPLSLLMQAGHHVVVASGASREDKWEADLVAQKPVDHAFRLDAPPPAPPPVASSSPPPVATAPPSATAPPVAAPGPPPSPPPAGMSNMRLAGIVTAGVGGALIVTGVITGAIGQSKLSSLDGKCPGKRCAPGLKSDADSINTLRTVTDVLWIGGAVAAAAGVTLIVLGSDQPETTGKARGPRVAITPAGLPGGGGLLASGRF